METAASAWQIGTSSWRDHMPDRLLRIQYMSLAANLPVITYGILMLERSDEDAATGGGTIDVAATGKNRVTWYSIV